MSGRGTSSWGAGCGAFGLAGLLVSVGIAVWLSSRVASDTHGTLQSAKGAGRPQATLHVEARPARDLTEGQTVAVAGYGYPAGATISALLCARPDHGTLSCAPSTEISIQVDLFQSYQGTLVVHRLLKTTAGTVDCASLGSHCEVRVSDADHGREASAPLAFAS
jgi:hypothetical protein